MTHPLWLAQLVHPFVRTQNLSMYWERETVFFFCAVSCQLYNTPENHLYMCSLGVQHVLHQPELYTESN